LSVKILCAGCSKEEREQAEADVRKALADRSAAGDWMVSLVKLADRWSVTLDAPFAKMRGVTVVAPQGRLGDSIRAALSGTPAAPAAVAPARAVAPASAAPAAKRPPAPVPPPAARDGRLTCEKCGGGFIVVCDSRPGESLESAPVACPHCWHVNRVLIDAEAAFNRDYRAEKA
jgi:hypothetical protein